MRILIVNLHSARNLGDDAIMRATLMGLREAFTSAQISLAANDAESWRKYAGVEVLDSLACWSADPAQGHWRGRVWRMFAQIIALYCAALGYRLFGVRLLWGTGAQRSLLAAYYAADVVLSCGGGNFYAHRPFSPALLWALLTVDFAARLGKPVVMLPQSFGPIAGRLQCGLARRILNRMRCIMAREPRAASYLVEVLHVTTPVRQIPDLAFSLADPARPHVSSQPPQVGVTVMNRGAQTSDFSRQQEYEEAIVGLLLHLARKQGAQLHVFVQCYGPSPDQDDRIVARRICERVSAAGVEIRLSADFTDALQVIEAYGKLDLVVGTRMHTGIFALCRAVPVLLIGYQPKACGMMTLLDLDRYCCDIADANVDTLATLADEMLARPEVIRARIGQHLPDVLAALAMWVTVLQEATWHESA